MYTKITQYTKDILIIALMMLTTVFCNIDTQAAEVAVQSAKAKPVKAISNPIKIIGKTKDNKYDVYQLEGELDDINWFSNGVSYNGGELAKRMIFIKKEDIGNGYKCGFICVDGFQNVVGLNPNMAFLYQKK